jgi:serine/threonine-protein kinase RsbW
VQVSRTDHGPESSGSQPDAPLGEAGVPEYAVGAYEPIEVRIAAAPSQLPAVRVMAGDLATRLDFDLDAVSDLRMAVDEACATLVSLAAPGARLSCRFDTLPTELRVVAEVPSESAEPPRTDTFGWQVLKTLTDTVDAEVRPIEGTDLTTTASPRHLVRIRLVKRRPAAVVR